MYIDSHLHLSNEDYDIDEVIKNAERVGVLYFILGGINKEITKMDVELSKKYKEIYITVGYHPEEVLNIQEDDFNVLEDLIINNREKVVGIGEIGLDYHYDNSDYIKEKQKNLFIRQIKLAEKYNLPVVIHSRDATLDTYNILKEYKVKGVIHCFSGSLEVAKMYIKLGFKLGIGGVVTFKNSKLFEVVKELSSKDFILETDSPYLSPIRGEKNEPKNIPLIAEFISSVRGVSIEKVQTDTTNNVKEIFNLKI